MNDDAILLSSDHAGFLLKQYLIKRLQKDKFIIKDLGVFNGQPSDYPDVISGAAKLISEGIYKKGIFICGSGIGASIVANRFKGVRAGLVYNKKIAQLSRLHNDANVMVLGSRFLSPRKAYALFKVWHATPFSDEQRHKIRVEKTDIKLME